MGNKAERKHGGGVLHSVDLSAARAPLPAAALLLCVAGCTRAYLPVRDRIEHSEALDVAVDRVTLQWLGNRSFVVEARTAAVAGAHLEEVRLERRDEAPCRGGTLFIDVYVDGVVQPEGPVPLGGEHRVRLVFNGREAATGPLSAYTTVDFLLDGTCMRMELTSEEMPSRWRLDPSSAGFLAGAGGRAFPFSSTGGAPQGLPVWLALFREGATFGPYRVWAEVAAGTDGTTQVGTALVSVGGDAVVWSQGRWSASLGAAYDLATVGPTAEHAPLWYDLHGPRVTPTLSFTPFSLAQVPGFPTGHRTGTIELEVPVSGWFGVEEPGTGPRVPRFLVAPGIGLGFHYAL